MGTPNCVFIHNKCAQNQISPKLSLPTPTTCHPRNKGVLMRSAAISAELYLPSQSIMDMPDSSLSPSLSKNSLNLSASLNLSPTSATSPLFGHSHPLTSSSLSRTARATGGSSTSLASTSNGTSYGYEISQELLDKQVGVLERKYGGREAREAAIKIQRAFRSYRLQKRFTCLAIQAISHQKQQMHKLQNSRRSSSNTEGITNATNDIDSLSAKSFEEADCSTLKNHQASKQSANSVVNDKAYLPPSYMTELSSINSYNAKNNHTKQTPPTPSITLANNFDCAYSPNTSYSYNQPTGNRDNLKQLQKKSSFSSNSSSASSSSLHGTSMSSKPSITTTTISSKTTKDYSDRNSQQLQQQIQKQKFQKHQSQSQSSIDNLHKSMPMTRYPGTTNSALLTPLNSVSFAPSVEYVNSLVSSNTTDNVVASAANALDTYRLRQYRVGINLFNKSPSERGIRFLIANGFIEQLDNMDEQSKHVAHFLLTRKGISRQMIGEYISSHNAFNKSVLKAFSSEINLSGIIVDEALRLYQKNFRFPGKTFS